MRKRLLSVIMVLALIIAMAPAAFAAEVETFDTWDGTITTPEKLAMFIKLMQLKILWASPPLLMAMSLTLTRYY